MNNYAPDASGGGMILLSDGSVLVKSNTDTAYLDIYGNVWDKLTPDPYGSYANGTWSQVAPMNNTRCYFSSQLLRDGRLYVAGGEYGTGLATGEIYDPLKDTWTPIWPLGDTLYDACSEMLPDGRVLQSSFAFYDQGTLIFDPLTNQFERGPTCRGNHDESSWLKLTDSSILFVDLQSRKSERYIPALDAWIADGAVPVSLYDNIYGEQGAAFLLPNGEGFFLGATGHTAFYTPSGGTTPGRWRTGPNIPDTLGTPDAPAAMMNNGKILCAFSPIATSKNPFNGPTWFYEFDYVTESFTKVSGPYGDDTIGDPCFGTSMLDLPDGTVLFAMQNSNDYFIYIPDGQPIATGQPVINTISQQGCGLYMATGTQFNGISEGAAYGDDWQMATNYPIVQLRANALVYYTRTFNWSSNSLQTGYFPDTTYFTLPDSLPFGTYSLVVIANGISSNPVSFTYSTCTGITEIPSENKLSVYPNPANEIATLDFTTKNGGAYDVILTDIQGRVIDNGKGAAISGNNLHVLNLNLIPAGIYFVSVSMVEENFKAKLVVR